MEDKANNMINEQLLNTKIYDLQCQVQNLSNKTETQCCSQKNKPKILKLIKIKPAVQINNDSLEESVVLLKNTNEQIKLHDQIMTCDTNHKMH